MTQTQLISAPELEVCHWINSKVPLSIAELRGKVVVLHAFQMLCPGCVVHGIPQASSIQALYPEEEVQVIGLHTVFEHHDVMTIAALEVFVKEYRLQFPIAVDTPGNASVEPRTMRKYQLRGTPSLVLIDKAGYVRLNHFGRLSDMQVGSLIGRLVQEGEESQTKDEIESRQTTQSQSGSATASCNDEGCALP